MAQLEITGMTFGPFGIGRLDGKSVIMPHTAPGDLVEFEIERERRDYTMARLVGVVRAGADRRGAPCPFLPRCGGCDWQHLNYPAQLRLKAEIVAAELERVCGVKLGRDFLIEPAPAEFGFRSRIRLKVGPRGELGYYGFGTHEVVEIDHCMVAAPELKLPVELARSLAGRVSELELVKAGSRQVIVGRMRQKPGPQQVVRAQRILQSEPHVAGIVLRAGQARIALGDVLVRYEVEAGLELEVEADLFSQVNREQNRKLVAYVMEQAAPGADLPLLDLFCGAGNFSLPAARRGAIVTGVDVDEGAIAAATRNATRLGFANAKFMAMEAADAARFLVRAGLRPQAVIVDPPRQGAPTLMEVIAALRPARVIYVSCDPSTLARDVRTLGRKGFKLSQARAFDFFPNTHHVEVATTVLLT